MSIIIVISLTLVGLIVIKKVINIRMTLINNKDSDVELANIDEVKRINSNSAKELKSFVDKHF